jgi:hypothetical protein
MAGKVRVETSGDVTIAGNLTVAGTLTTSAVSIKGNGFGKLLEVQNEQGQTVAEIDNTGLAKFNEINVGKVTASSEAREAVDIPAGQTEVAVLKTWTAPPNSVLVTPSYNTQAWVSDITQMGFILHVASPAETPQKLYWWAVW